MDEADLDGGCGRRLFEGTSVFGNAIVAARYSFLSGYVLVYWIRSRTTHLKRFEIVLILRNVHIARNRIDQVLHGDMTFNPGPFDYSSVSKR